MTNLGGNLQGGGIWAKNANHSYEKGPPARFWGSLREHYGKLNERYSKLKEGLRNVKVN